MHKSIRNLNILLILTPIMLLLIWFLAVKKTVTLNSDLKSINQRMEALQDAPKQVLLLENRIEQIDKLIGNSSQNIGSDEIFSLISKYIIGKRRIEVIDFPLKSAFINKNYQINTYAIKIQGSFFQLMQMLNYFENDKSIGKIVGVSFIVEKDLKTKRNYLNMYMYLQTYQKKVDNT